MPRRKTIEIPELTNKDKERFFSKIRKGAEDECWPWIAGKTGPGYGEFKLKGKVYSSSRITYFLEFGEISEDLDCLHSCDNPPCCNPFHLFLGSHKDNMDDKYSKGRGGHLIGEMHPNSKLIESQVLEIRKSSLPRKDLAEKFNVSIWAVGDIVTGRRWTHV